MTIEKVKFSHLS